jgi:hypothetical protein
LGRRRKSKVWLGKVSSIRRDAAQLTLMHDTFPAMLERALDPDWVVSYYGRDWRLAQPRFANDRVWGKLGFARRSRTAAVEYDEEHHDWITQESPARQGNYSHFVIDLESQYIAFEEKGVDITHKSFLNAMGQFLMRAGLEVNLLSDANTFETWLANVDRVTRFYVSLKAPNPGFSRRAAETRRITEEIAAERLSIEATSEGGLNVSNTLLEGAAETAALGNGSFKATGFAGQARRFFDSAKKYLTGVIEVSDEDSSDTIQAKIDGLLHELAPELEQPAVPDAPVARVQQAEPPRPAELEAGESEGPDSAPDVPDVDE